ncbi:broad specificity phosphatase PhoE [Pararhizobium capsulatum DSM 1112]|uniref:Broad specificity phosphatase PhoE n=1 Tax=Pararhizobium capsulatum DSM 1112 TaxID=1121113 RepID=A0ABU0BUY6_9HYPH|nr:histidine phosphatase family protein [Pararhizobium capsulatum]MDQ0321534.1 broad specificity phosphatase PhoE [Pararhizobium capsulatum DSM 1112]
MSRATRLTLICRGETASAKLSRFSSDEPLLEGEHDKAAAVATTLRTIGRLLTAPEQSAQETAAAIGGTPVVDPVFRDLSFDRWQGRTLADIAASTPDELGLWMTDPSAAPHGGESIAQLFDRTAHWMAENRAAGGHTAAVTHPVVIRAIVLSVLDAPLSSFWKLDVGLLSLTELTSDGRRWVVQSLGKVLHGRETVQ